MPSLTVLRNLRVKQAELIKRIPLLQQSELVETSVAQYCEAAKVRYEKCDSFETKRQFLLDYIEKVVFWDEKIMVCGSVPVKSPEGESKIDFKITDYSDYRPNGRCRTG